jgi:pimeloyl-ACP methyl ester carboxylesterase
LLLGLLGVIALAALIIVGLSVHTRMYQTQDRRAVAPSGSEFVTAADTQVLVQRAGDPRAPAVVFVHGTGSWSELWRASMQQVAALGLHAVALDLPPFGYSIPPASGNYSKAAQARRILGALDTLGIDQAIYVGHSFGAGPMMEAVFAAPRRVRGVVLVDAALGLRSPVVDGDTTLQSLARQRWLSETLSAAILTNPVFTKTLLRAFVSEKERATDAWVAVYRRPLFVDDAYRGVAAWLPELLRGRGHAMSDDPNRYAALGVPVTLIWGETDTITPLEQALNLQQRISGSALLRLPRAGHIPQIEAPESFAAALAKAVTRAGGQAN